MKELLEKLKNNEISQRSFIATIKNSKEYIEEVEKETVFLNEYDVDILERIYYIIKDIKSVVKCQYCDNKAKWTGRINEGYKVTCCSKECESKRISEQKTGLTNISENRDNKFIEWQNSLSNDIIINDDFIKDNIKYDKFIDLLTNERIINYLKNRFNDSDSLLESYQRILFKVEKKPLCSVCGKAVNWIGKKNKLYTRYCSDKCSANSEETKQKKVETLLANWGTEHCYDSEKHRNMLKEKYGVEYIFQKKEVKEKRKETFIKKYGTTNLYEINEIVDKIKKTNKERYGVDWVFQREDIRDKAYESTKNNSGTSKQEETVYNMLIELGYNVERWKKIKGTNWTIDFYLPDYDLYIEYQGSQYHNGRAYIGTKEDLYEIEFLKQKDLERKQITNESTQYENIINTWSKRDVEKRKWMLEHNYNFLELYDCLNINVLKTQISLYINCLQNKNVFRDYYNQNILINEFEYFKNLDITDLNIKYTSNNNRIIKYFQDIFYKKEMEIYAHNPILRRKLIQNRCKYLNKKEKDLTISDIFSGFKNGGIHYGYSHFNPVWTNWFINHYDIKTVFDPCGGWGHHLLGMLSCDKIIYNDINSDIYNGVKEMIQYFGIDNLELYNEDIRDFDLTEDVDAWFMCPPYYNLEDYGNDSFKDIEEYREFLNIIFGKWKDSNSGIFGMVIREDYYELLDDVFKGLCIDKCVLKVSKSHLVKKKKFGEYFYIFRK